MIGFDVGGMCERDGPSDDDPLLLTEIAGLLGHPVPNDAEVKIHRDFTPPDIFRLYRNSVPEAVRIDVSKTFHSLVCPFGVEHDNAGFYLMMDSEGRVVARCSHGECSKEHGSLKLNFDEVLESGDDKLQFLVALGTRFFPAANVEADMVARHVIDAEGDGDRVFTLVAGVPSAGEKPWTTAVRISTLRTLIYNRMHCFGNFTKRIGTGRATHTGVQPVTYRDVFRRAVDGKTMRISLDPMFKPLTIAQMWEEREQARMASPDSWPDQLESLMEKGKCFEYENDRLNTFVRPSVFYQRENEANGRILLNAWKAHMSESDLGFLFANLKYQFQHGRSGVACLINGLQGCGKSLLLGRCLLNFFAPHTLTVNRGSQISDTFNAFIFSYIFILLDDVKRGSVERNDFLMLTTGEEGLARGMHQMQETGRLYTNVFALYNDTAPPVTVEEGYQRRVLSLSMHLPNPVPSYDYWAGLVKAADDGGTAWLVRHILSDEVSPQAFEYGIAPVTDGTRKEKTRQMPFAYYIGGWLVTHSAFVFNMGVVDHVALNGGGPTKLNAGEADWMAGFWCEYEKDIGNAHWSGAPGRRTTEKEQMTRVLQNVFSPSFQVEQTRNGMREVTFLAPWEEAVKNYRCEFYYQALEQLEGAMTQAEIRNRLRGGGVPVPIPIVDEEGEELPCPASQPQPAELHEVYHYQAADAPVVPLPSVRMIDMVDEEMYEPAGYQHSILYDYANEFAALDQIENAVRPSELIDEELGCTESPVSDDSPMVAPNWIEDEAEEQGEN
jgi:hypothetical protein